MTNTALPRPLRPWLQALPFVAVHLAVLAVFWTGITLEAVAVGVALYLVRMFAVTAGYHRYFSHRSFQTGRVFQFALAFLAQTSAQKGALWWAAHHRRHHKYSDAPEDVHSPRQRGLFYAHVGWIFDPANGETDWDRIPDLRRYSELVFLDRFDLLPPTLLAIAVLLLFGWSGLVVGFFASTVLLWHGTFLVNSLAHRIGRRRFETTDDSRNSALIALVTLGEGWHNNHHFYPGAARQGFYRRELDPTWGVLRVLERLGVVRGLREPPARVLELGRRLDAGRRQAGAAAAASARPGARAGVAGTARRARTAGRPSVSLPGS